MGFLDWFGKRKTKKTEEEELLERTGKLRTKIEEHVEEKPKKRKRKKESS